MNETNSKNTKLRNALLRALGAVLAGVLLLTSTGFSIVDLIRKPSATENILEEEQGAFVKSDVFAIFGFYDSEIIDGEMQAGNYALVPMGGKLLTVHFTDRYRESADTIMNDTYKLLNGTINKLDNYAVVQGTVSMLTEEESGMMYDWYAENKESMIALNIIGDNNDATTYLDDVVLEVDTVNGHGQTFVIVMTSIAALCVLYALIILVLMGTGHYLVIPDVDKSEEDEDADEDGDDEEEKTGEDEVNDESEESSADLNEGEAESEEEN